MHSLNSLLSTSWSAISAQSVALLLIAAWLIRKHGHSRLLAIAIRRHHAIDKRELAGFLQVLICERCGQIHPLAGNAPAPDVCTACGKPLQANDVG